MTHPEPNVATTEKLRVLFTDAGLAKLDKYSVPHALAIWQVEDQLNGENGHIVDKPGPWYVSIDPGTSLALYASDIVTRVELVPDTQPNDSDGGFLSGELIFANEDGRIDISDAAEQFAERCAALIREKLPGTQRRSRLMPYRRPFGYEFLGFDWSDETGATLGFTFSYDPESQPCLPDPVWPHMNCIVVQDVTDALHLCRLIAERVNGDPAGVSLAKCVAPFTCKYCGSESWIDPADQSPPPDYCHEIDHGTAEDRATH